MKMLTGKSTRDPTYRWSLGTGNDSGICSCQSGQSGRGSTSDILLQKLSHNVIELEEQEKKYAKKTLGVLNNSCKQFVIIGSSPDHF